MKKHLQSRLKAARKSGDVDTQLEILEQLLSLARQGNNTVTEIALLREQGNAYQEKSELQKAHSCRVTALERANDLGLGCPRKVLMAVEGDLGRSFIASHDAVRAEFHTLQALQIAEELHDHTAQCIYTLNLENIYMNTNRVERVYDLATEVLGYAEPLHDHYLLGLQHLFLAELAFREHRLNDCQEHARKASAQAEFLANMEMRNDAQQILANSLRVAYLWTKRRGYATEAEEVFGQIVKQAQEHGNVPQEVHGEIEWAWLCDNIGRSRDAIIHYERALEALERMRRNFGYEEFQLTYFHSSQTVYEAITEFFLRQQQADQAFLVSERLRNRILLTLLGQGHSNAHAWPTEQRNELTEILDTYGREVLRNYMRNVQRGGSRQMTVGLQAEDENEMISKTRQRFLHLYEAQRLYRANWETLQSPPIIHFAEAQRILGKDDALLVYMATEQSVIIFAATSEKRHFQHLHYSGEKIANDVKELRLAMEDAQHLILHTPTHHDWFSRKPQDPWPKAIVQPMKRLQYSLEKLYALLITPILSVIDQKPHWVIVPYGPLHLLPWAALRSSDHYLVEHHAISLLPSCSVGAVLEQYRSPDAGEAIFFADPDPDDTDLQLPKSQEEVQAGYRVLQAGPLPFCGYAATKFELLKHASQARLLHLACHHCFDKSVPFLSFLKLAGPSGADYLYTFEIADLRLSAELVVLSACESGYSHIEAGDEQYGIVRAFLAAGARSVISTLWSIEDESAAVFFTEFYKMARTSGLGQALVATQRHLLADARYELPCFWAAYALSGQWNRSLTFLQ